MRGVAAKPGSLARMSLALVSGGKKARPIITLVFGIEGVGKTTFAAGAPAPVFLCAEDGTGHMDVQRLPEPECWDDAIAACELLARGGHPFKTLVIDSLDWLEKLCWSDVCLQKRWDSIEDGGFGKGYVEATERWVSLADGVRRVRDAGLHVVLIAHGQIKAFRNPEGEDYDRWELKLHKGAGSLWKEAADAVLFAAYETSVRKNRGELKAKAQMTGERLLYAQRTAAYDAKNRFNLPESLPLSWRAYIEAVGEAVPLPGSPEVEAAKAAFDAVAATLPARVPNAAGALVPREQAVQAIRAKSGDDPGKIRKATEQLRRMVAPKVPPAPPAAAPPDEPDDEPAPGPPSERPPADPQNQWGFQGEVPDDHDGPQRDPSSALIVSTSQPHTPSSPPGPAAPALELAAPKASPHTTLPASALPHLPAPVTTEGTPKPPATSDPALERLRAHFEQSVMGFDRFRFKDSSGTEIDEDRKEFRRRYISALTTGHLLEGIEIVWRQLSPKAYSDMLSAACVRHGADFPGILADLKAKRLSRGKAMLAAESRRKASAVEPQRAPEAPPGDDSPETVASAYVADARDASTQGELDELEVGLREDGRLHGEHRRRAETAIKARRVTLEAMVVGSSREES